MILFGSWDLYGLITQPGWDIWDGAHPGCHKPTIRKSPFWKGWDKPTITQLLGVFICIIICIYGIEFPTVLTVVQKVDGDDWVIICYNGNCLLQYVGFLNPYHGKWGYTPTIIGSDQKHVDIYGISTPWRARVSTWKTGVGWSLPSPKLT